MTTWGTNPSQSLVDIMQDYNEWIDRSCQILECEKLIGYPKQMSKRPTIGFNCSLLVLIWKPLIIYYIP